MNKKNIPKLLTFEMPQDFQIFIKQFVILDYIIRLSKMSIQIPSQNYDSTYYSDESSVFESKVEVLTKSRKMIQKEPVQKRKYQKAKGHRPFTIGHTIRFFMFYLKYKTDHPYYNMSWQDWKPTGLYPNMSTFINMKEGLEPKD